ncbi:MAG: hypothetical protein ABFD18_06250 [Syntrophomonas sp.]
MAKQRVNPRVENQGTESQEEITKYPREELLANAEALFNVKAEIMLGALHNNTQQEFTIDEMRKAVDDFLQRRVK